MAKHPPKLFIDGREVGALGIDLLAEQLAGLVQRPFAEAWLRDENGAALSLLKSGDRAFLMLIRFEGDAGMTSRSQPPSGSKAVLKFKLGNGQVDEYSIAWTVSFEDARRVMEEFWFTRAPSKNIAWQDDSI